MITTTRPTRPRSSPLALASGVVPAAERYPAAHFVEEVKQWILDDPRLRRHPAGAPRPALRRRASASTPPSTSACRPQAEAAVAAVLPDPNGPDASLVADRGGHRLRAGDGRRPRLLRRQPHRQAQPGHPGPRQAGSSFKPLVLATALTQGHRPAHPDLGPVLHQHPWRHRPPWRPVQLRRRRRRHGRPSPRARSARTTRSTRSSSCGSAPRRRWRAPPATGS